MTAAALNRPASETPKVPDDVRDLMLRFQRAQVVIANDVGRIVSDIAQHPRHNEHMAELGRLVRLAEQLREVAQIAAARIK